MPTADSNSPLYIGWAEADITPQELPVSIAGQFHIRISEGVADPLVATAFVLQSGDTHVVFVSVDTVVILEDLSLAVAARLNEPGLDVANVILHATHTHEAPDMGIHTPVVGAPFDAASEGIDLGFIPAKNYVNFAASHIAEAISQAWRNRAPGGIAYGQDFAVIGRNRRWVDTSGVASTYGLDENSAERFHHIEGYEDHSLNLLATYAPNGALTGIVVNVPSPSQESESSVEVSADFWHEARRELRARYGEKLFILPQCSAAGELTSHLIFDNAASERMLRLRARTEREEVARRIGDATERILPYLPPTIDYAPVLKHTYEILQLPLNQLSEADLEAARSEAEKWETAYREERDRLLNDSAARQQPRFHESMTWAFNRAAWNRGVLARHQQAKEGARYPSPVHIVRLGEIAFATNPFEYYLDFGIQIKVKSRALQTFVVQLAGSGTYLPSPRAAAGGGYGAVPASCPVGPEGGRQIVDFSVSKISEYFSTES